MPIKKISEFTEGNISNDSLLLIENNGAGYKITADSLREFLDEKQEYELLVESANEEYAIDSVNGKFSFTQNANQHIAYAYFSNTMYQTKNGKATNTRYFIVAKGENGCCLINDCGNWFYLYYDYPVHSPVGLNGNLTAMGAGDFKLELADGKAIVSKIGGSTIEITLEQINTIMSTRSLENMIELKLGFSTAQPAGTDGACFEFETFGESGETPSEKTYTVACLGDSITQQAKYTTALANLGYNVLNYGISGTTISNKNPSNPFSSRVASMDASADFVFILGGTNDWGLGATLGEKTDTTEDTFYGGLYTTLTALREKYPTKTIFISEILQRNWQGGGQASGLDSNANSDSVMDFNEAIRYMGERFGCFVVPSFSCGICLSNLSTYLSDGVHLNDLGGSKFATYLDAFFRNYPIYEE